MAQKYDVTNLTRGPRGFHEVGKSEPTVIARGQTLPLVVEGDIEKLLHRMADKTPPQVEIVDRGPADEAKAPAPTKKTVAAAAPPAPAANEPPKPGEYAPTLEFDKMDADQLRAYLTVEQVNFHPATGQPKLLAKALEHDRAQWDEAQKKKPAAGSGEAI